VVAADSLNRAMIELEKEFERMISILRMSMITVVDNVSVISYGSGFKYVSHKEPLRH
jgi:hypothetical protein